MTAQLPSSKGLGIVPSSDVGKLVGAISLLILGCILWIYLLPGLAAYAGNVHVDKGVAQRVPVLRPSNAGRSINPPPVVSFTQDQITHLLFLVYLFLSMVAASYVARGAVFRWREFLAWAAFLYLLYNWVHWLRTFGFYGTERAAFAYSDPDIHLPSFILLELRIFGITALGAAIITLASGEKAGDDVVSTSSLESLALSGSTLSRDFVLWQIRSILLAAAFIPLLYHYWGRLVGKHDGRYFVTAILAQLMWASLWVAISFRVLRGWLAWHNERSQVFVELSREPEGKHAGEALKLIEKMSPASSVQAFFSSIVAISTFFGPILARLFGR